MRALSPQELIDLTGYTRSAEQAEVLRKHGLTPIIGRDGRVTITWEAITEACCGRLVAKNGGHNWSAARRRA